MDLGKFSSQWNATEYFLSERNQIPNHITAKFCNDYTKQIHDYISYISQILIVFSLCYSETYL